MNEHKSANTEIKELKVYLRKAKRARNVSTAIQAMEICKKIIDRSLDRLHSSSADIYFEEVFN